nr:RNA-dependent RNA polymerase [Red mite virga-like virus 1]
MFALTASSAPVTPQATTPALFSSVPAHLIQPHFFNVPSHLNAGIANPAFPAGVVYTQASPARTGSPSEHPLTPRVIVNPNPWLGTPPAQTSPPQAPRRNRRRGSPAVLELAEITQINTPRHVVETSFVDPDPSSSSVSDDYYTPSSQRPSGGRGRLPKWRQRALAPPAAAPICTPDPVQPTRGPSNLDQLTGYCRLAGLSSEEAMRNHMQNQLTNPNSQINATIDRLVIEVAQERARLINPNEPPVVIRSVLTVAQQTKLQQLFPSLDIKFTSDVTAGHAFARAHRQLTHRLQLRLCGYYSRRVSLRGRYLIKDVGANATMHINSGNYGVHCCCPILSARDAQRHSNTAVRALECSTSTDPNVANAAGNFLAALTAHNGKGKQRPDRPFCFNRSQNCTVRANYLTFLHSTYDMDIQDIAYAMEAAGASQARGVIIFDPQILTNDTGYLTAIDCTYSRYTDDAGIRRIRFAFNNDTQLSYDHRLDTYLSILRNIYINTNTNSYHITIDDISTHHLFFTVTRNAFPHSANGERLYRSFIEMAGERYVSVDYWDWVTCTLGGWIYGGSDHMVRRRIIVPRSLYDNIYSFLLTCAPSRFTIDQALTIANSFNTRVVQNGVDVSVPERVSPDIVSKLAHAVYFLVYVARHNDGKVVQALTREENRVRAMGDRNIIAAQIYRAFFAVTDPSSQQTCDDGDGLIARFRRMLRYKHRYPVTVESAVTVHDFDYTIGDLYGHTYTAEDIIAAPGQTIMRDFRPDPPPQDTAVSTPSTITATPTRARLSPDDTTAIREAAAAVTHNGVGATPVSVAPVELVSAANCATDALLEVIDVDGTDGRCCARALAAAALVADVESYVNSAPRFEPPGGVDELRYHSAQLARSICVHEPGLHRHLQIHNPDHDSWIHIHLADEHYSSTLVMRDGIECVRPIEDDAVEGALWHVAECALPQLKADFDIPSALGARRGFLVTEQLVRYTGVRAVRFFGDDRARESLVELGVTIDPGAGVFYFAPLITNKTTAADVSAQLRTCAASMAGASTIIARLSAHRTFIPIIQSLERSHTTALRPYAVPPLSREFYLVARGPKTGSTLARQLVGRVNAERNAIARTMLRCFRDNAQPTIIYNYTVDPVRRLPPTPRPEGIAPHDVVEDYRQYLARLIEVRDGNIRETWRNFRDLVADDCGGVEHALRTSPDNLAFVTSELRDGIKHTRFLTRPKVPSDEYSRYFDGSSYVSFSKLQPGIIGLVSDYTAMYVDHLMLSRLQLPTDFDLSQYQIDFKRGVPGCGKTTYLLNDFKVDGTCLYMTSTRAGKADVRERVTRDLTKRNGRGPTDAENAVLKNNIRTYASAHIMGPPVGVEHIMLDEVLMQHPGVVLTIIAQTPGARVTAVGDTRQIPFVSRVEGAITRYSSLADVVEPTGELNISYRCPADVACIWAPTYTTSTTNGIAFSSASGVTGPTMTFLQINSAADVPSEADAHYLTYMQSEKAELISRGLRRVNTIHEYQGNQARTIYLVRLRDKPSDTIYEKVEYALVATTRHTIKFIYASVYRPDDLVRSLVRRSSALGPATLAHYTVQPTGRGSNYRDHAYPVYALRAPESRVPLMRGPVDVTLPADRIMRASEVRAVVAEHPRIVSAPPGDIAGDNIIRVVRAGARAGVPIASARPVGRNRVTDESISSFVVANAPFIVNVITRWERVLTLRIDVDQPEITGPTSAALLQDYHDTIFPGNSQFEPRTINYQSNLSDIAFNSTSLKKYTSIHRVFSHRSYDTAEPALLTCAPVVRPSTWRESLHAILKRNMCVADGMGFVDETALAGDCFRLFVDTYISSRELLTSFRQDPIGVNEVLVTEWLDRQDNLDPSAIVPETPVHLTPVNHYRFAIKTSPKPDLTTNAPLKHNPVQTIVFHSKDINAVFCPILREVKRRLLVALCDNVIFFADMSPAELGRRLERHDLHRDLWAHTSEGDIGKYDKSQALTALLIDCHLMREFGVTDELVDLWFRGHYHAVVRDFANRMEFEVAYQRKSGDASTLLGNTVFLMCVLAYLVRHANRVAGCTVYDLRRCVVLASGDDSYVFGADCLSNTADVARDVFNLELKCLRYDSKYFCSKYLVRTPGCVYVCPDPVKMLVKLGRTDMRNPEHVEEYRSSLLDLTRDYGAPGVSDALDAAVADRHPSYRGRSGLALALRSAVLDHDLFHSLFLFYDGGHYLSDPNPTLQ